MSWRSRSYNELPALSVRGPELRSNLRTVTMAWMYGIVWWACIVGSQTPMFQKEIGFNNFHFGLASAIPSLATISQLIAALLIERTGLRKFQFLHCGTAHRLMWIPIALVPLLLPTPSPLAVWAVLAMLAISWFNESLGRPAWMTWMSDLIPRRIRGRYFAFRGRITSVIMIAVVIGLGLLMDKNWAVWNFVNDTLHLNFIHGESEAQKSKLMLYTICGVYFVGALFGATDILLFSRIREVRPSVSHLTPPSTESIRSQLVSMFVEPFGDRLFRNYVFYSFALTFSITCSDIYYWLFSMRKLGFNSSATNLLFLVFAPIAALLASPFWGRQIDRWGRRPVLILTTIGATISLLPWFLATPSTPHPQFVETALNWASSHLSQLVGQGPWNVVSRQTPIGAYMLAMSGLIMAGISWSGIGLAQLGVVLDLGSGSGRSKTVAASYVLVSVGGFLGGFVGGCVTEWLDGCTPVGPFQWTGLTAVFGLAILVRLSSIAWLLGMPDHGSRPVRALLNQFRVNILSMFQSRPLRILGPGTQRTRTADDSVDAQDRA